eukprot:Tamp_16668.p1 GENE.Tamp_16668~~Tamp_16668.p1  ORF type:complete len:430 (+),score=131.21 Tamp_16668:41-1330(+)
MSLEEVVQRLSEQLERLERERSRDQDVLDVLRKFDADLLHRVLDLGSQAVLAQDYQLWSTAKGVDQTVAKEKQDRLRDDPVKPLLLAGANPNGYKDKNGETALHVAAAGGKQNVVTSLLASKAVVNAVSLKGETPLHKAQYFYDPAPIVASLLASKAEVNQQSAEGKTPLDIAEREEAKALLREHGGKHSLLHAVVNNMPEEAAELIKEGADVNQQNADGNTLLDIAEIEEEDIDGFVVDPDKDCVKALLREHGGKHSLFGAVKNNMLEEAAELIKEGADVNQQNANGSTLLDIAKEEEVKALLREHGGKHSLHHAVKNNMLEEAAELIKEGADVNQLGGEENGQSIFVTPLLMATFSENKAMVALLLASKADVNPAPHEEAGTPLDLAQKEKMEEIVDLLKAHGACEPSPTDFPTLQDRLEILEYRLS